MRSLLVAVLIMAHMTLNVLANISYKLSSAGGWRRYLTWQVVGNVSGFAGVQALTGLMSLIPLHVAFPVTQGLAVIGVQVVAARLVLHEAITPRQWVGTGLVVAGIALISGRQA